MNKPCLLIKGVARYSGQNIFFYNVDEVELVGKDIKEGLGVLEHCLVVKYVVLHAIIIIMFRLNMSIIMLFRLV